MKKIIFTLLMLVGLSAKANVINIDLTNTHVSVGDTTQLTLTANGFDSFEYFEFDLNYDIALFSFDPLSFFSGIGTLDWDTVAEENPEGMTLIFFGTPVAAGSNILAQFNLLAIGSGVSSFTLSNVLFFDDVADLVVDSTASSSASAVSEPASLLLTGLAGLALLGFRRKA